MDVRPDATIVSRNALATSSTTCNVPFNATTTIFPHDAPPELVPLALAALHRATTVGETVTVAFDRDVFTPQRIRDLVEGGGFDLVSQRGGRVRATRLRTLPDYVGPAMRLLCVGLNPSEYAADAGIGFARPGNRFWPAALAAGVVTRDRDPEYAVRHDRVGMTDLVKRATKSASALDAPEYRHGLARVERLVAWLQPRTVCMVGLTGWRAGVARHAVAGWQAERLGGRPVYVMPNPSGVNAHTTPAQLATHLRHAAAPH